MAYTTLAQGSSVVLTFNDAFDSVEVLNRPQDLATVALTSGAWAYGATPQQHSGRRTYQLSGAGSITVTAASGALQYEQTNSSDLGGMLTAAEVLALRSGVTGAWDQLRAGGGVQNRLLKKFSDAVGVSAANSGTAATVSIDAASPFGRAAYKVAMPAGNTYHEVQLSGFNIASFNAHVIWSVWVEDYTAVTQIQAFAGTSGYSRFYQQTHNISNSNLNRLNGEHRIVVGPLAAGVTNTFVAGTDTFADTKLRIFPGAGGANVWIDACVVPTAGRPTHLLTHDDCSVTWIANALPYLSQYNLKGTFGINSGDIGGSASIYLSSAQVLAIATAGHQISPHNVTNTSYADGTGGTQTAAQYTADFVTASAALSAIVGSRMDPSYHPWVQGRTNQSVMDTMRTAGLRVARGTDGGYNFPQAGTGGHVLQLKNQALHTLTQAQILTICTTAKTYGATVCWMIHELTANGGVGVETAVANYAYLCGLIGADVSAGLAVNRTMSTFARELYDDGLVPTTLLS